MQTKNTLNISSFETVRLKNKELPSSQLSAFARLAFTKSIPQVLVDFLAKKSVNAVVSTLPVIMESNVILRNVTHSIFA